MVIPGTGGVDQLHLKRDARVYTYLIYGDNCMLKAIPLEYKQQTDHGDGFRRLA